MSRFSRKSPSASPDAKKKKRGRPRKKKLVEKYIISIESMTQAEKVIRLFENLEIGGVNYRSGAMGLAAALKLTGGTYNRQAIYKWTWPVEKSGTGGVIPTRALLAIEKAARMLGIFIPPGYLDPRGHRILTRKRTYVEVGEDLLK